MQNKSQTGYLERNKILTLLSDEEVARVSRAESEASMTKGDEYIDLSHLEKGVQRADTSLSMHNLLPKAAVREATWVEIVASLTPAQP